jgi:hypothetical protein
MNIINTPADLQNSANTEAKQRLLQNLLNDYVTFDDAEYPEGYDHMLKPGDEGYIEPVIRKEWNAGAAAGWGFTNREQIEAALEAQ